MRFCTLASGSSGNSSYAGTSSTHLLMDAGISRKKIKDRLNEIDIDFSDLDGVLITHEHSDHINGLKVLAKHSDMPFYATIGTIRAIMCTPGFEHIPRDRFIEIKENCDTVIGDITVHPFPVSHDALQPVGYSLVSGKEKLTICTDLGVYTETVEKALEGSQVVLLEANHDIDMLKNGPYPYYLKQRILGDHGHLSNNDSGDLLNHFLSAGVEQVFLGHLSAINNFPTLAVKTVREEIKNSDSAFAGEAGDIPLDVAPRDVRSALVEW